MYVEDMTLDEALTARYELMCEFRIPRSEQIRWDLEDLDAHIDSLRPRFSDRRVYDAPK